MEKQTHKGAPPNSWVIVAGGALLAVILFFAVSGGRENGVEKNITLHLVYSPYCPHCHELMRYLSELNASVEKTKNGKEAAAILSRYGLKWDGGVPLLYSEINRSLIAIEGFPASGQVKGGYFISKEYEEELCNRTGGKPIFINGKYAFCRLPNGFYLGNYHSVRWLLNLCSKYNCR